MIQNLQHNSYITKEETAYLKGWAILIMIFLHVFGARAIHLPAYKLLDDFYINNLPLSYQLSKFCSICVHLYIFFSGYGFYILYQKKIEKNANMHIIKRIVMLLMKVLLIGCIFYPISIFYPELHWNFDLMECAQMLLGYKGNYEWWFLRPYIVISIISPLILKCIDKRIWTTIGIVIFIHYTTKFLIYKDISLMPLILEQSIILLLPFILGAVCAKRRILYISAQLLGHNTLNVLFAVIILLLMVIYKTIFPSGILDPFISVLFCICVLIVKDCLKKVYPLFLALGKEATSIWLIHTFISVYYWSELTYSLKYPPLIFLFVIVTSYIFARAISILYNPVKRIFP